MYAVAGKLTSLLSSMHLITTFGGTFQLTMRRLLDRSFTLDSATPPDHYLFLSAGLLSLAWQRDLAVEGLIVNVSVGGHALGVSITRISLR